MKRKIAIGGDGKSAAASFVIQHLKERGFEVQLYGAFVQEKALWSDVALDVAQRLVRGEVNEAILFCWTGTGVCLAANKVLGIRAVLCHDAETAKGARYWDHANLLCLSLRSLSEAMAKEILDAWFSGEFSQEKEDLECIEIIKRFEEHR